jgi:hypothetical protein
LQASLPNPRSPLAKVDTLATKPTSPRCTDYLLLGRSV